ncbi:2-iminoacetate synthase ThiH [Clostridium sp. 'deep sea']|uniref:2-iminoacetate synthase ThiH n=1 Tax=Clostridium sp. 'deep sea' TaxID=2779445 RepID=UPI0018966530|nr:2-iminoacetate synthase ThiH [Clostridium sp. 'deep sea']QOR36742.1 2-iminoacetate synthase ThiH [Clostridium sp. 'deep sea']
MSFYKEYLKYKHFVFNTFFSSVTKENVIRSISQHQLSMNDYLNLLSPTAEGLLEQIAQKAHSLTVQNFGKTIQLYTPMYLANYCINKCAYCGFNIGNKIARKQLNMAEIKAEAQSISATGLRHILILTGESNKHTPVSYIVDAVKVLKQYFDSIAIEIYPLTQEEYCRVVEAGVDSLTVYQEVYNETIYDKVHISGPKKNYRFRLDAVERGCLAKMHSVNIGALLGLDDWRKEAFFTGIHANYLQNKYPDVEVGVSLPRLRPHIGSFNSFINIEEKNMVQMMIALRVFMPRVAINISTRESKSFRNNLVPLGVTKMSAGVSTKVGGHSADSTSDSQFEISDNRNVAEMKQYLLSRGYQPVCKDWLQL